ncbi:hypothetical protein LINPERHAP1_LOCUS20834 [Linum perenne]
MQQSFVNIEDY